VRRGGERIDEPLGNFVLRPGDVLLLDTGRGFRGAHEASEEFFLTSEAGGEAPGGKEVPEEERAGGYDLYISVGVLAGIITLVAANVLHIALAAVLGVAILLATNVIEPGEARKSVDWSVLIVIGAALGLGKAMEESGLATAIAHQVIDVAKVFGHYGILAGIIIITAILTQVITNNGAAALMFPIGLSVAQSHGVDPRSIFICITLSASMAFLTPIGYQTNLMVYGPGNYRFADFFKVGFPLQVLIWVVMILLAPVIWVL
jgi:di/tricarboxylate transporter